MSDADGRPWLDRLLLLTLLLCCGMTLSKSQADPDFWGHVQYGRDVLAHGLPAQATYTYTAEGHRWINHENLAELCFALGVDTWGPSALLILKCLAGMGALALILRQARRQQVGQLAAFSGALLVTGNMMLFWTLRPQLFSFVFFVLLLVILEAAFASWNPQRGGGRWSGVRLGMLSLVVPLTAVWTNSHGGFLAGLCVLSAYLGLRAVEALRRQGRTAAPLVLALAAVALLAGLSTLLNPYGWQLHRWLLQSLGEPRPEIVEWRRPELSWPWLPFWLLAAAVPATALSTRRPRDMVQLIVISLVLWQAIEHRRHVVFLALLFGFWMLPHWDSLLRRLGVGGDERTIGESLQGVARHAFTAGLLGAAALLTISLYGQLRQIPVRHDSYPVAAFQYMRDHQLQGKLLTRLKWAQYAIAAFGSLDQQPHSMRLAFDGRFRTCYPQQVVDLYFDFADGDSSALRHRSPHSPPPQAGRILHDYPPDLVLIDRCQGSPVRVMQQQEQWVLLYQDSLCQLWSRSDSERLPSVSQRRVSDAPQTGITAWPALPRRGRSPQSQLAGSGSS